MMLGRPAQLRLAVFLAFALCCVVQALVAAEAE
jgi:hypothetical protein